MLTLLIILYVLQANGVVIPIGCFIATWVLVIIRAVCSFIKSLANTSKDD
jgi:hypothetical protein